jgi:hypothetical protein
MQMWEHCLVNDRAYVANLHYSFYLEPELYDGAKGRQRARS